MDDAPRRTLAKTYVKLLYSHRLTGVSSLRSAVREETLSMALPYDGVHMIRLSTILRAESSVRRLFDLTAFFFSFSALSWSASSLLGGARTPGV